MPEFPATRFKGAGASEDELAQLTSEFERSDITVQSSQDEYYKGVAEGDLREYLDRLREADHFKTSETEPKDETEPLAADSIPVPTSGAPTPVGDLPAPPDTEVAVPK